MEVLFGFAKRGWGDGTAQCVRGFLMERLDTGSLWISTKKKGVSCDDHLIPFCSISWAKHGLVVLDPLYH